MKSANQHPEQLAEFSEPPTVKDLIEKLQEFPPDAEIIVNFQEETGGGSITTLDGDIASLWFEDDEPDARVIVMSVKCDCSECVKIRNAMAATTGTVCAEPC